MHGATSDRKHLQPDDRVEAPVATAGHPGWTAAVGVEMLDFRSQIECRHGLRFAFTAKLAIGLRSCCRIGRPDGPHITLNAARGC